jgi:hypothetical protein
MLSFSRRTRRSRRLRSTSVALATMPPNMPVPVRMIRIAIILPAVLSGWMSP